MTGPLSRRERVRLLRRLVELLTARDDSPRWTAESINVLFLEFGLEPADGDDPYWADVMTRRLSAVDDLALQELYGTVFDEPAAGASPGASELDAGGLWRSGMVRLFLSHSARHKAFAGDVAEGLTAVGVSAFVAHDVMEVTRPWQSQIERALRSAEAFAVLLHEEVNASAWCQQEIGWALGRGLPYFVVRMGADPAGFPGATQWPSAYGSDARDVVRHVAGWLNRDEALSARVAGGLLVALREAGSYYAAEAGAKALDSLGTLPGDQLAELDKIVLENDQVGGSVLATRALSPLYARHQRHWPSRS